MDLLLQAAKVLELEQSSDVGSDRVSPRSTRGPFFQPTPRSRGENSENSDGSLSYSENGLVGGEDDVPLADRRRAGGRKQLRECFSQLQQVVPSLENKRVATQSILQGAIKHIKNLKKKDVEQEREIQMLAKRKSELKKKYDIEFNKCTEEEHRAAEVILQVIRSKSRSGPIPPRAAVAARLEVEEDDGHTSDSTTTASEGPCNDGDFSDDEVNPGPLQPSAYPVRLERKRKMETGGPGRAHSNVRGESSSQQPGLVSSGSKPYQHTSSSSVSSSSLALKQMLEQKKRNQESVPLPSGSKQSPRDGQTSAKVENLVSSFRPVAPALGNMVRGAALAPPAHTKATKGLAKSASSLTSSYPMISNHLAASIYKPVNLSPSVMLQQDKAQPSVSPLVDVWTTSSKSLLGTKAAPDVRSSPVTPVKMTDPDLSSSMMLRADGSGTKLLQSNLPTFTGPTPLPPIFTTTTLALPNSIPSAGTPIVASPNNTKLQLHQNFPTGLKTPEAKKLDNPFILSPKAMSVLQSSDVQGAALLGKNIIGSNTSIASLQSMTATSPLSTGDWTNSKIVPAIIPLSLASFLRGMPIQGGVGPLASFASGPTIPISMASVRTPLTATSWPSVSPMPSSVSVNASVESQAVKVEPQLGNHTLPLAPGTPSSAKQDPLSTAISLTSTSTRIASLLAGGGIPTSVSSPPSSVSHASNSVIDLSSKSNKQMIGSVLTQTSTVATTSSAAATVTLSLPDGLKPMTFAPTLLPLTWATNVPLAAGMTNQTGGTISGAAAGQLRLFAPLSHTAPLTNGQSVNGLMPTVVQLGSSGQMALLQHHPHLQVQPNPAQHLLTQPIVVMTTQTSAGPLNTSGPGLVSVSSANLTTAVSSSSIL
ncbi:MAX-binding protein MNT [Elysia marginata]|uniref:MAX-binding protein MNT n=1 Tax=Elysia marginata TaxID=1093978 RepID=A0AAV4HXE7_9GAST|nr:MAX-binding protein MNT [Elysia marginata]